MTERYITIHGHFYQPPRENPWLEAIERQESAHPYHDWNARVAGECYAPNAAARILDGEGRITRIVDNYRLLSCDFGPTLLSWMEAKDPETYRAILDADRASIERFSGHGSAIAQAYGHIILPLASGRDKRTQIAWGIRDFEHRFGRRPEGMWLPETAVDFETLEALAEAGIGYTILAPHQAAAVRPFGEHEWRDVTGARIDRGRPYLQRLPSGRTIAIVFYDGPLSQAVAFEGLLADGEAFARRMIGAFQEGAVGPRLVHLATDGETYGHHHKQGEMALAWALQRIEGDETVELTNYGEYLERHPPTDEIQILENTSWSCVHGVERWRADCGCSGGHPGWHQRWRAPLRAALDWLRDELAPRYEATAGGLLRDPWSARDGYIDVILDRSRESVDRFFAGHAARELSGEERVRALELLELQRHAMLMYTSCGWFFDELSGTETVQVIQYASRAVQLARDLFGEESLEERFLERLQHAESNLPDKRDGRRVYELHVRPAMVDLNKVGAHYAVTSLFDDYDDDERIYCYEVAREDERRSASGRARLIIGRARVRSVITLREATLAYAAVHLGDHNLVGGVRTFRGEEAYRALAQDIEQAFSHGDFPAVLRKLDEAFAASMYSLRSLFYDEQRRILRRILEESIRRATAQYEQIYESRASLMRFVADLGVPAPRAFRMAAEFVINRRLRAAIAEEDLAEAERLLDAARHEDVEIDHVDLSFVGKRALDRAARRLIQAPDDPGHLERLVRLVDFVHRLPFHVPLHGVQNNYWRLLQNVYPTVRERADTGDPAARRWCERFEALGIELRVAVEAAIQEAVAG
jgi:alpha-amylase/alpha-mannosidase (GH57 family)